MNQEIYDLILSFWSPTKQLQEDILLYNLYRKSMKTLDTCEEVLHYYGYDMRNSLSGCKLLMMKLLDPRVLRCNISSMLKLEICIHCKKLPKTYHAVRDFSF